MTRPGMIFMPLKTVNTKLEAKLTKKPVSATRSQRSDAELVGPLEVQYRHRATMMMHIRYISAYNTEAMANPFRMAGTDLSQAPRPYPYIVTLITLYNI